MDTTIVIGQKRKVVSERTARIITWLCEHDAKVAEPIQVGVSFDCAGAKVRAQIVETEQIEKMGQA
jgi:hypothetical protein